MVEIKHHPQNNHHHHSLLFDVLINASKSGRLKIVCGEAKNSCLAGGPCWERVEE